MLNLFFLSNSENIFVSSVSITMLTLAYSRKGFLKESIDEVLFPTAVEIGYGSINVGKSPFPSKLYSHLPTYGLSKIMVPDSTMSRLLGEY